MTEYFKRVYQVGCPHCGAIIDCFGSAISLNMERHRVTGTIEFFGSHYCEKES